MFWPPGWTPRVRGALNRVWRASTASTLRLRNFFYKNKVVGKVCFSGGRSYFWARILDLEVPGPHVLLEPWSIIFRQILIYKMCSTPSQQSTWSGLDLLHLALTLNQGSGALNRVWTKSTASTVILGKNFIKQNLQGRSVLVRADYSFGPVIQIWKDLGPMCFWSHGQSFSGKFF